MTGTEDQIGGFDIIYRGTAVKAPTSAVFGSSLGCFNNRAKQLKKLAKGAAARLAQEHGNMSVSSQGSATGTTMASGPGAGSKPARDHN